MVKPVSKRVCSAVVAEDERRAKDSTMCMCMISTKIEEVRNNKAVFTIPSLLYDY